jgi:hypothetical protein
MTSTAISLLAKFDSSGKTFASINASLPASEVWAVSEHMSNTYCLHSTSVMLCRGLQGPLAS